MSAPAVRRRLTPIIALLAGLASVLGLVAAAPIAVAQPTARSAPSSAADAVRTGGGSHGAKPTVVLVHGCHVFPDVNAQGGGEDPQWLHTVRFDGRDLWGDDADPTVAVSVDAFEPYLEAAP